MLPSRAASFVGAIAACESGNGRRDQVPLFVRCRTAFTRSCCTATKRETHAVVSRQMCERLSCDDAGDNIGDEDLESSKKRLGRVRLAGVIREVVKPRFGGYPARRCSEGAACGFVEDVQLAPLIDEIPKQELRNEMLEPRVLAILCHPKPLHILKVVQYHRNASP